MTLDPSCSLGSISTRSTRVMTNLVVHVAGHLHGQDFSEEGEEGGRLLDGLDAERYSVRSPIAVVEAASMMASLSKAVVLLVTPGLRPPVFGFGSAPPLGFGGPQPFASA